MAVGACWYVCNLYAVAVPVLNVPSWGRVALSRSVLVVVTVGIVVQWLVDQLHAPLCALDLLVMLQTLLLEIGVHAAEDVQIVGAEECDAAADLKVFCQHFDARK